jgi:hypothetical protein
MMMFRVADVASSRNWCKKMLGHFCQMQEWTHGPVGVSHDMVQSLSDLPPPLYHEMGEHNIYQTKRKLEKPKEEKWHRRKSTKVS